jgi:hypothetical protein
MALAFTQQPGAIMPGQSPIVFSVRDTTSVYTASAFQYTADIYSWTGTPNNSGSTPNYTLRKYPNASGSGIFDISRFIIGTFPTSNFISDPFVYYKVNFNFVYNSGSVVVSGSTLTASTTGSVNYQSYDGYYTNPNNDFNVSLNQQSPSSPYPFLTDATTVTQSTLVTDTGQISVYAGQSAPATQTFTFVGTYVNGTTSTVTASITNSISSSAQAGNLNAFPAQASFPLTTTNLVSYKISTGSLALNFVVDCATKYPSKRILFKNKYGGKEWINMNLVSTTTVNGDSKSFRPQLGNWNSTSFNYDNTQVQNQKYISDAIEVLTLNTEYLSDNYNNIIEQLMVSDEIYLYDSSLSSGNGLYTPLEIISNTLQFKTGVVNKLIQYTFQFRKNNYKLIL